MCRLCTRLWQLRWQGSQPHPTGRTVRNKRWKGSLLGELRFRKPSYKMCSRPRLNMLVGYVSTHQGQILGKKYNDKAHACVLWDILTWAVRSVTFQITNVSSAYVTGRKGNTSQWLRCYSRVPRANHNVNDDTAICSSLCEEPYKVSIQAAQWGPLHAHWGEGCGALTHL